MNPIHNFEDVFRSRMFRIPDYQRGYSWETRNWNDLLEDLELLPNGRSHFTGTLVLCSIGDERFRDESGQTYGVYEVIDGQQRLTTIVLFLDAIHDEMNRLGMISLANGLKRMYLAVEDLNKRPHTRLTLNRDSQEFFHNDVLGFSPTTNGPTIRSHQRLLDAHQHFVNYLIGKQKELGEQYNAWLQDHYFKITQQLMVLIYETNNELDAGIIFETMNDRGKTLTELEKVKNYLMYLASKLEKDPRDELIKCINVTWNHIFESLMAAGLADVDHEDQLLRAHWLMMMDYNLKNWKQSRSVKDSFSLKDYKDSLGDLFQDLIEYLNVLRDSATAYCDIRNPRKASFNEIADRDLRQRVLDASEKLARLGARATFVPLLMAVRLKAGDGGQTYLQVVELCEKFDFRVYQWARARASAAQYIFYQMGYEFFQRPSREKLLSSLVSTILDYCSNARFEERFTSETEDWYHYWGGLKYFLYEYEQYLARQAHEKLRMHWEDLWDVKRDTIEHILPQTPTQTWLKSFPDETRRERWTHDIGNLTLTYDNSALQNKSFADKKGQPAQKSCYASSSFFVERQITGFTRWTEAEIIQRREAIRVWALERWNLDETLIIEKATVIANEPAEKRLLRMAEENGKLDEFQALLAAARKLPVYVRMQRNWQVVTITLPQNKNQALLWMGPNLYVEFNIAAIEQSLKFPRARLQALFGDLALHSLESSEVDDFITKLNLMFEEIKKPV